MIDSGASQHLCNSLAYIADYEPLTHKKVLLGDNRIIPVGGRGHVDVNITARWTVNIGQLQRRPLRTGHRSQPAVRVTDDLIWPAGVVQRTALHHQVQSRPLHRMR
jgi:hypothetical protein